MDSTNGTVAQTVTSEDNGFMKNLESNFRNMVEEIRHCDEQTNAWQVRKKELQEELKDIMDRVQKELGGEETSSPKSKEVTTPKLICNYLEKHGPARTSDIRKFLLANGKKTGPGVALGRLVKEKAIENVDRGLYKLANS